MNSTYHTTYQYHFCLGENLLRGDGAQSCLSVCHQSSLSSPLSSPLLYWLRHQCWQIIQSGDDAAFRQSVIFPNNCANKPSLSALSCSLQPDPSNQVMWLTSPTIYRHVSVRITHWLTERWLPVPLLTIYYRGLTTQSTDTHSWGGCSKPLQIVTAGG